MKYPSFSATSLVSPNWHPPALHSRLGSHVFVILNKVKTVYIFTGVGLRTYCWGYCMVEQPIRVLLSKKSKIEKSKILYK